MSDEREAPGALVTHVARAGWDEHELRGHRLFGELAGSTPLASLTVIAVGGRALDAGEAAMLDDLAVCMAVAEPLIWPLKLARLVASYGSAMAGYCAGHAMLEGGAIGPWTSAACARMLVDLAAEAGDPNDDARVREVAAALVARTRWLIGFGVPFRPKDERVVALARCVEARGRAGLSYWRLLMALAGEVRAERRLEVNIGAAAAAVLLDVGLRPEEVAPVAMALTSNTFLANALEGAAMQSEALRRLPTDAVRYVGKPPRAVARER
jgi:hypothetical protein